MQVLDWAYAGAVRGCLAAPTEQAAGSRPSHRVRAESLCMGRSFITRNRDPGPISSER